MKTKTVDQSPQRKIDPRHAIVDDWSSIQTIQRRKRSATGITGSLRAIFCNPPS